jgi:hypothetical protein
VSNPSYPLRWTLLGIITLSLLILAYYQRNLPSPTLTSCRLPHNAAWISVDWTSQPVDRAAIQQLAGDMATRRIRYLFPFTTYIREDGFSPSYTYAAEFVSQFRKFNQETYLLAWIGVPLKREGEIGLAGWTDLANAKERADIITFVVDLVEEASFDCVHLNVETVWDNDADYLLFLKEMQQALDSKHLLSLTGHTWRPDTELPSSSDYRWSSDYYREVASRVDQIVPMTYDSMAATPASYQLWLNEQVQGITRSLVNSEVELLLGTSISRESTITHNPKIETLPNSLAGICESLSGLGRATHSVQGIAIYAAWEADEKDWQVWETWVNFPSEPISNP